MIARAAGLIVTLGALWLTWGAWVASPVTGIIVERSEARIAASIDRALARLRPETIETRITAALAAGAHDEAVALADLARDLGLALSPGTLDAISAHHGFTTALGDCAACVLDLDRCANLSMIAICVIPAEMTPLGDGLAISRGLASDPVDRFEAGLGALGLAATGAALVTGGSSLAVKSGATVLRVARRAGHLSPGLQADITRHLGAFVAEARRGGASIAPTRAATLLRSPSGQALTDLAQGARRLSGAVPPTHVIPILSHAENAAELARLSRVAAAAKDRTRPALALLGKPRLLRMTRGVSVLGAALAGLVTALVAQIAALALAAIRVILVRYLRRSPA